MTFFNYQDKIISEIIKRLKYGYETEITSTIQDILDIVYINYFSTISRLLVDRTVISVPLYPLKKRKRGFNQADIISRIICNKFGLSLLAGGLQKIKNTGAQADLEKAQRENNLKDCFSWDKKLTAPVKVLLVDDVFTTGTTMRECVKVLQQNGVKDILIFVFASG